MGFRYYRQTNLNPHQIAFHPSQCQLTPRGVFVFINDHQAARDHNPRLKHAHILIEDEIIDACFSQNCLSKVQRGGISGRYNTSHNPYFGRIPTLRKRPDRKVLSALSFGKMAGSNSLPRPAASRSSRASI